MLAILLDEQYRRTRAVVADPVCGTDFCDDCGDCLDCYPGDGCGGSESGRHLWVINAKDVEAFLAAHPEVTPAG